MLQSVFIAVPAMVLLLGLIVFLKSPKNQVNIFFLLTTISMAIWIVFNFAIDTTSSSKTAFLLMRLDFSSASLMVYFFLLFCLSYPGKKLNYEYIFLLLVLPLIFGFLTFNTKLIIEGTYYINNGYEVTYGLLEYVYDAFIITYVISGIVSLFIKFKKAQGLERSQLLSMFIGLFFMVIITAIFNLLGPILFPEIPTINRLGSTGFLIFLIFTGYAIVKQQLFNIKVILTETATVLVILAIFIQLLLSNTAQERIVNFVILILVSYGGYLLIKSVQDEIRKKEKLQDLTTQLARANAHLQELDKMKTEFVSLASHELLTPVSAIEGYLSMLLDEKLAKVEDPTTQRYLDRVYRSAKRLARLIADMLNISRIEEGRLAVEKKDTELGELIRQVIDEIKFKSEEGKQKVIFNLPVTNNQSPITYPSYVDPEKIKEVVINLIGNSIKYSKDPGTITVTITEVPTTQIEQTWANIENTIKNQPLDAQEAIKSAADPSLRQLVGEKQYLISVKDHGIGIPKEELPKLFIKFHRVGDFTTAESQGTGLGLYISRALVELNHGRIWADSEGSGHGSTFSFSVPTAAAKPEILKLEENLPKSDQLKPLARPAEKAEEL